MAASKEEINILLLGETGVGKSTFINALANYFKFDRFNDAISGEIDVLITSRFTMTNDDYEMQTITVTSETSEDEDEYYMVDEVGESSTQKCGVYVFEADGGRVIRLIDTPGIGDTRGIKHDEKNFENILRNISQHEYLNGICILLKPNNARMNIIFKFCIQELLSHLHKSAKDNIVFCFTNTRGTFFRPGDTLPVLKRQLQEFKEKFDIEIKIYKDIIYCFDNEPFRFLAAHKKGMKFTDDEKKNFASSWERSAKESERLLQYIKKCTPHKIIDTVSLNNARQTVLLLREPLAEIGKNIQENIVEIIKLKEEIQRNDFTNQELKNKLYVPHLELKIIPIDRPKIVCKSSECQAHYIGTTTRICHVKWKDLHKTQYLYFTTFLSNF
ncbi:4436_t:CDS:1 [Dentiscutata heterogama]|uniref:4436_t:CDS:1 n=1 Tax=Dentiscutata heterogama TaxID=1316150 RepID=A0ACA9KUA1_9GLOM|nr:4436_t:CDS:1 [Dentiscutata heterogama]